MQPYLIMLADDHAEMRQEMKRILANRKDIQIIGEAGDGDELLKLFGRHPSKPNMVILDISMPTLSGIEAARRIKKVDPRVKILILTIHREREYLVQAIAAGVEGYLLKEDVGNELFFAIRAIQQGGSYFSSPSISFPPEGEREDEGNN